MTDLALKKSLLTCPGDSIQEHIDAAGMSQAELAERLGRSIPKLNELIRGKAPITKETAAKLEYVLGVPASFWLNLERQYQDVLFEIEQMEFLEQCKAWVQGFPLPELRKLKVVSDTRDKKRLTADLLKFFRVASPTEWSTIYEGSSIAFKIELKHTTEPKAISAWLRLGELQTEHIDLKPFDKNMLKTSLSNIQEIAYQHSDTWMQDLQKICASFGVALVYTPCISKAPIYGASRWIKNKTVPLIQITDRRKDYNAFWFTFFHELAHIRYHNKSDIFINGIEEISPDKNKEDEADAFASRMLLSDKDRRLLAGYPKFNVELVQQLSKKLKKHPGIIVAQMQREGRIDYKDAQLTKLKVKVRFGEVIVRQL